MTPAVEKLLASAESFAGEDNWERAFDQLAKAIALAPRDSRIFRRAALFLFFNGRTEAARTYFEAVVSLEPLSPDAHFLLGVALAFESRYQDALAAVSESLRLLPDQIMAVKLLVMMLSQIHAHDEAKQLLEKAVRHHPRDGELLVFRGAYAALASEWNAAVSEFDRALFLDPSLMEAQAALNASRILSRKSDCDRSRRLVMLVEDRRIDRRVLDEAQSLQNAGWDLTVIAGRPPEHHPFWDEECYPALDIVRAGSLFTLTTHLEVGGKKIRCSVRLSNGSPDAATLNAHVTDLLPDTSWHSFVQDRLDFVLDAIRCPSSVVVAHDLPALPLAAIAARHHGARLVYDSHELFPDQYHDQELWKRLYDLEKWLLPHVDLVITVNESFAGVLRERYGVTPHVILNCPAQDRRSLPIPRSNRVREKLGIPEHMRILLYQGGLVIGLRNLEEMIEAMTSVRHDDVALVLMGPDGGGKGDLMDFARARGVLDSRVFFHESVRQNELLQCSASADAGIIPYPSLGLLNQYYCTPNKTFEFIVAGIPILANDLPELRRFVADQGVGMNVCMDTAKDIARAIDLFFDGGVETFRRRAKELSCMYVWDSQGKKVVELYERFSARKRISNIAAAALVEY